MIQDTIEKVWMRRDRFKMPYGRQTSYAIKRKRDLEFELGDKVYIKVSPMKGVMKFRKKGKFRPRYVGP